MSRKCCLTPVKGHVRNLLEIDLKIDGPNMNSTSHFATTAAKAFCFGTVITMGLSGAAFAQEAATTPEITGLSTGTPVEASSDIGQPYVLETHGDWSITCLKAPEGAADPCSMFQLLKDDQENPVAEISLFHLGNGEVDAGATVTVPLDTLLTQPLTLTVDGANGRRYPYTVCMPAGCQARLGFTKADVDLFRKGQNATLEIVPYAAPDVKVPVTVSLTGFTAAYKRVTEVNLAARGVAQ
jgi:invasion protein IalB